MCRWFMRGCAKCVYHCWFGCGVPSCRYYGFCKWPHGCCYSVMALFSAYMSLYMNFTVVMSCFYQQITELNPVTGELIMTSRTGYGMLARQISYGETADYQQCLYYPEDEQSVLEDTWMKGSTYSAYACAVLQVIGCVVLSFTCCCAFSKVTFERWLMWVYIYASCFMALTFLMFGAHFCKENDCDMANGSGLAISAWMFLVCCANMVKNMGQPPPADMVDPDDDEDNLWYDDDADRFPRRYADEDDEYAYEEEEEEDSFGGDEFAYDDGYNNDQDRGVELQDTDFLKNNSTQDDPNNNGGMVPYFNPDDPHMQPGNNGPPPPNYNGGMVAHANPDNPYAQYSQVPPPETGGGMVPHEDPNDPSYAQTPQIGDKDGPELI